MVNDPNNTWAAKCKRTLTCLLPVSDRRRGQCVHCGACCKLPNVCPFLKTNDKGEGYCGVYPLRPLNCRKYPRTEAEHITKDTCGFYFEEC
jgi:hypothetical protein